MCRVSTVKSDESCDILDRNMYTNYKLLCTIFPTKQDLGFMRKNNPS